jgi:Cft2 family RNA processing exonuclease
MMVENTPSYVLASGLIAHARNTIGFVGYCDPDTPGGRLLLSKPGDTIVFEKIHVKAKLKARIEKYELSGHADREELLEFAVQTGARSIVLTHGDPPARAWFAEELARQAPKSKVIDPVPLKTYQV